MPFADVNGKQLYYTLRSADSRHHKSGLSILLVHGLGSSSSFYGPVIPHLAAAGFTCLAVDTHGMFLSKQFLYWSQTAASLATDSGAGSCLSKYNGQKQTVKTIAQDALALLSSLSILPDSVIAVGHSMGGLIVSELALQAELAGVVLVGPVAANPLAATAFSKRIETVQKGETSLGDK